MKTKLSLLIIFLAVAVNVYSKSGGGGGHSSEHSSSHESVSEHSVSHTSGEHSVYVSHTFSKSEYHQQYHNNQIMFYVLMMNHHTSRIDTVYGKTKEDIQTSINGGSGNTLSWIVALLLGCLGLAILVLIAINLNKAI